MTFLVFKRRFYSIDRRSFERTLSKSKFHDKLVSFFQLLNQHKEISSKSLMMNFFGYSLRKSKSTVEGAGFGVFLDGQTQIGDLIAIYPGTIYRIGESILLQSVFNKFILKRKDDVFIDGNDRFLSRFIFKQCANRDNNSIMDHQGRIVIDTSWLNFKDYLEKNNHNHNNLQYQEISGLGRQNIPIIRNPLALGHYINSCDRNNKESLLTNSHLANVQYLEFDFTREFFEDPKIAGFVPNVNFSFVHEDDYLLNGRNDALTSGSQASVLLISTKKIESGSELFASYFAIAE